MIAIYGEHGPTLLLFYSEIAEKSLSDLTRISSALLPPQQHAAPARPRLSYSGRHEDEKDSCFCPSQGGL